MNNIEIQEKFGFIIEDAEFRKNYMHLLTEPFFTKYIEVMGKPEDYPDLARYYEILSFALLGYQIQLRLSEGDSGGTYEKPLEDNM